MLTLKTILGFTFTSPVSGCLAVNAASMVDRSVGVNRWHGAVRDATLGRGGVCLPVEGTTALRRECVRELPVYITGEAVTEGFVGTLHVRVHI